ncbi:MAG: hypothetical protein MJ189_05495, partial [Coriobacteriales bacterium]|nr:hypothetical protein [Coriobacteriales bacterium]
LQGSACGYDSVSSEASGICHKCPVCEFDAYSFCRVSQASTSTGSGFEHYYRNFVDAANKYRESATEASKLNEELNKSASDISEILKNALSSLGAKRYDPQPPGRYGCIAIVTSDATKNPLNTNFFKINDFTGKIAISGATLAPDENTNEADVISSFGSNIFQNEKMTNPIIRTIFGSWSKLLKGYCDANVKIETTINEFLNCIPIVGNELSSKAAGMFKKALNSVGLSPPNLKCYKPVLVNTSLVLQKDDSKFANILKNIKEKANASSVSQLANLLSLARSNINSSEFKNYIEANKFNLFNIDLACLGEDRANIKFQFNLPADILDAFEESIKGALKCLGS